MGPYSARRGWLFLVEEWVKGRPPVRCTLTALAAFVEAVALNWFINETGWTTGAGGALIGLYAGLGFIATAFFSQVLFAGRPPRLYAIDAGYQVFQAVVLAAIIGFLGGGRLG